MCNHPNREEAMVCVCGHGWFAHIPPEIHKDGVSCTVTLFTGKANRPTVPCMCPLFVDARMAAVVEGEQ